MVKPTVTHPDHGLLLGRKKEWIIDSCSNMDEPQGRYAEWKRANLKKATYCIMSILSVMNWHSYRDGDEIN